MVSQGGRAGYAVAQFCLGALYVDGEGVPLDRELAYAWNNLAAAQGNEHAVEIRTILQEIMTPAQIAEAEKLSRDLVD